MTSRSFLSALLGLLFLAVSPCSAQQRPARNVPQVSPEQLALEQKLQGEYRGSIRTQPSVFSSKPVALQVVAQGQGKFIAWKYENGLPGSGWQQDGRYQYTGQLADGIVDFTNDSFTIRVDGETATVYMPNGRLAGTLAKVVRESPTMGASAPGGALVLFGEGPSQLLQQPRVTPEGWLGVGTQTIDAFQDFCMHLEFRIPFEPAARGQGRGNSGVYLQGRYELQILDSYGLEGIENECGAIYTQRRPLLNMCLPPMVWQTYDLDFTMARFDVAGKKIQNAKISVWQNGVLVHDNYSIVNKTGQGLVEGPQPMPIKFQDHTNPVVFRNIWLLPKSMPVIARQAWLNLPLRSAPQPISPFAPPGARVLTQFTTAGNP